MINKKGNDREIEKSIVNWCLMYCQLIMIAVNKDRAESDGGWWLRLVIRPSLFIKDLAEQGSYDWKRVFLIEKMGLLREKRLGCPEPRGAEGRRKDGIVQAKPHSRAVWAMGRLHSWLLCSGESLEALSSGGKAPGRMFKGSHFVVVCGAPGYQGTDGWVGVMSRPLKNTVEHLTALLPMWPGSSESEKTPFLRNLPTPF